MSCSCEFDFTVNSSILFDSSGRLQLSDVCEACFTYLAYPLLNLPSPQNVGIGGDSISTETIRKDGPKTDQKCQRLVSKYNWLMQWYAKYAADIMLIGLEVPER